MFQSPSQGSHRIYNSSGGEITSTNLTNGNISYLREVHQRMLIELFIGEYSNDGVLIPYDMDTQKKELQKGFKFALKMEIV